LLKIRGVLPQTRILPLQLAILVVQPRQRNINHMLCRWRQLAGDMRRPVGRKRRVLCREKLGFEVGDAGGM